MSRKSSKCSGFTLIELAIVLVISGMLMAGFLQAYSVRLQQQKWQKTQENLAATQAALEAFVRRNRRLPCPALDYLNYTDPEYQQEASCNDNTLSEKILVLRSNDGKEVFFGKVPSRTLGISENLARDGWKNHLNYAVTRSATVDSGWNSGNPYSQGAIKILNGSRLDILDPPAIYVLLSYGVNNQGMSMSADGKITVCSSTSLEEENCDADSVFIQAPYSQGAGEGYYDDFVIHDRNVTYQGDSTLVETMEKILQCQRQGSFYDPDDSAADTYGCISAGVTAGACPDGQVVKEIDRKGQIVCAPGMTASMCRGGEVLVGYDQNANAICSDIVLKILACAQSAKIYAGPGSSDSDANGCVTAAPRNP